jgi:threonine dehydrogenase-like Zn-dependent dehydrogenase
VSDPEILNPRDVIVRVRATAICGSDLHLYGGLIPTMKAGDILGHEFMGEIVEVGRGVTNVAVGDRVVVPFTISCGHCLFCHKQLWSLCENSNPNAKEASALYGSSGAGLFGYSHLFGGYAGGQAEFVRVPFGDIGPKKLPPGVSDEQAVMLADVFPTGYMAAENCAIEPGDTVAVWGCGPVGLFAMKSAWWMGAGRVIAIDRFPERLELAERFAKAETIDYAHEDPAERLREMTHGIGPDRCIDAVGMEAHGHSIDAWYDRVKQSVRLATDRAHALRQAIVACRKGGVVSIPGVYGGFLDKIPLGSAFTKGLTLKMGQTHVHRYLDPLIQRVESGDVDPAAIISHRGRLDDGADFYRIFRDKIDGCTKVVLKP